MVQSGTDLRRPHDRNQRLYNLVWRAAFLVTGNEEQANSIAAESVDPSAIKLDVSVPATVPAALVNTWSDVYKAAFNTCKTDDNARIIANQVTAKCEPDYVSDALASDTANDSTTKTGNSLLIQKKGGSVAASKSVKAMDLHPVGETGLVEGYLVSWGNAGDTDLQGEFFTPRTEFCLDWFEERPVLYHHGMDNTTGLKKIGTFKTIKADDMGLWVQAQLDLRDRYARAVYDMVQAKTFGWSSGSVDHLVKIGENGEILVWPLIEGSITPTPAQPAKTTVRTIKGLSNHNNNHHLNGDSYMTLQAFKSVVGEDASLHDFLRGLDARIKSNYSDYQSRVVNRGSNAQRYYKNDSFTGDTNSMAQNDGAWYITRAVAKAFGIKDATPEEIAAVADEVSGVISDEVNSAAAMALEEEAASVAQDVLEPASASYRRFRSNRGQSYRQVVPEAIEQDEFESALQDEVEPPVAAYGRGRARRSAYRQVVPDMPVQQDIQQDIEAAMMNEVAATMADEAMEVNAARALKLRAWRRAMRQISQMPEATLTDEPILQDNNMPNPYMQDDAFQQDIEAALQDPELSMQQDPVIAAVMQDTYGPAAMAGEQIISDVAAASYRRGFRGGLRSAYRQVDPSVPAATQQFEDAAVESEVEQIAAQTADTDVVAQAARAYRAGYRRGLRRAVRQLEQQTDSEEAMQQIDSPIVPEGTIAGYRGYGYRQVNPTDAVMQAELEAAMQDQGSLIPDGTLAGYRGYGYRQVNPTDAVMQAELEAAMQDVVAPPGTVAGYRGYGYRQATPETVAPIMGDDLTMAQMAEELESISQDQIFGETPVSKNFTPRAFRSVGGTVEAQQQAEYWRRRAMELEQVEAPNQRAFKSLQVRDVADRPGAYERAFKSYLIKGLGLMSDTEKYVLQGKGKARWDNATFAFDSATKSVKTYSSGSDASVGFLVPEDWVNELNKNVMTQTTMAPECKTRTTTSDRIVQPNLVTTDARRAHPAQVRWPGESPAANTDHRSVEDDYSQVTIPIHVMLISLAATNSALEDATFNLEEEINEAFAEAVAVSYDQLIWGGDGQGKIQGIVSNDQVTGTPSLNMKTVGGYVATGNADGIVTADTLKQMLFHLPQGYRQRAKWYMNSNTGLQIATLKDAEGNYLIDQRDDALRTVGVPDRLLNKPIVYNEWADDADTGNFPIVLADLSRGYIIGRRVEFSIRRFDDSNYAEHDQVLFLGRARLGGQVLQPAAFKVMKIAES